MILRKCKSLASLPEHMADITNRLQHSFPSPVLASEFCSTQFSKEYDQRPVKSYRVLSLSSGLVTS